MPVGYSNQLEHRRIDRRRIKQFLLELKKASLVETRRGRSRDEQSKYLSEELDPASSFEREFLDYLWKNGLRLPDYSQDQPTPEVHHQADFYYERQGVQGICVFTDGPHHNAPTQAAHDQQVRGEINNLGFRNVTISYARDLRGQITQNADVFGPV